MPSRVQYVLLFAIVVAALLAAAGSCTTKHSAPYGGGGGGGTTTKELDSGNIAASATFSHRFMTAGSFGYHCIYHTPMTGTVTVSASAPDTVAAVDITTSTAPFPAASVKPGGVVTWTNSTAMTHTVTSN